MTPIWAKTQERNSYQVRVLSFNDGYGTRLAGSLRSIEVTVSFIHGLGLFVGQLCVSSVASRHQR
jgi:hypothetical protein